MTTFNICRTDIFCTDSEAIVNPVNCVGVMGKGLALEFKKKYPQNFLAYEKACKENKVHLGKMFIYQRSELPYFIVNFPTKLHWRDKSRLEDIECGLINLSRWIGREKVKSISIPYIGCGLGGLNHHDVLPLVYLHLNNFPDLHVTVCSNP